MPFSGMLRCVARVRTYVSEEHLASIIRVTKIGEVGRTLAITSNRKTLRTLQMRPFKPVHYHYVYIMTCAK
jgi:hypothetical protein